jgi:uncharacterized membrane protein YkvA (DUF1232 family)
MRGTEQTDIPRHTIDLPGEPTAPRIRNLQGVSVAEKTLSEVEVVLQTRAEPKPQPWPERLKAPVRRFLKQFQIIRRALKHPQVPWYAKVVAGCAVLYVFSPIQIIPNFIPIIGQTDDLLVVSLGIKFLRRCVPQNVLDDCENNSRARM